MNDYVFLYHFGIFFFCTRLEYIFFLFPNFDGAFKGDEINWNKNKTNECL